VRAPVLASLWSSGPAAPHVRREFGSELLRCTYDRVTHFVHQVSQGAAASAFSPAASTLLARLNPNTRRGAAFGSYGFYKSLGYTAGPLLGGALVAAGGLRLLFITLTTLALAVAGWAATTVPAPPPLPRTRQTVLDLAHRLIEPTFLTPTAALAAATAALAVGVGVGYLPVSGRLDGLGPLATGAAVSVLALTAAITQPQAGRALDTHRIRADLGLGVGLALTALGLAAATIPGLTGLLLAALIIGAGTGLITPLAFATLAEHTDPERLGQTMGAAELGRELGDAGGPLIIGAVATAATLTTGYATLALIIAIPLLATTVHTITTTRRGA